MMSSTGPDHTEPLNRSLDRTVIGLLPLLVFLALLVSSVGIVVWFSQSQKSSLKQEFQENMLGIGTLKARQIDDWVEQYYRDALLLQTSSLLSQGVAQWVSKGRGQDEMSRVLIQRLHSRKSLLQYQEILLLSENGEVWLATSSDARVDEDLQRLVRQAMGDGQVRFSSIRRNPAPSGGIRLYVVVPLEREAAQGGGRIAALLLSIDVHQFLYPLLNEWPTPSRTAETLLVTREGEEVVFLNELRHRKNSALQFRLPIVQESPTPAVRGVLGERGIMEGLDYRLEPVLAATIPMRRMPWVMVAKIDQEEVYAPLRMQTWFSVVGILFVLAMTIVGLRLWWVNNTQALLRKGVDRLNRSQQLALVGSWDWDPYPDREEWSETLYALLGLPTGSVEANRITFQQCIHPDDRAQVMWELYDRLENGESFMRSYRIVRPDGQVCFVLEKGAVFRGRSGKINRVLGVLRDVTERKTAEAQEQFYIKQLEKSNRAYRALSRCNAIGYYAREEGRLFRDVCTIIQECCGYRLVWIGLAEQGPERRVRPVAHAGFDARCLEELNLSWGDAAAGYGPAGEAIRTGQPVLNQDPDVYPCLFSGFESDREGGYASSAAFPVCYAEQCLGVLNVYSDQSDAFVDEEVQLLREIAANVAHSLHLLRLRHRQQQDEFAVRRHRSQLQAVFDASSASILQMDLSGQILLANRSMMEMFGYAREELSELSYFDLLHPSQREAAKESLTSLIQVDAELLCRRRDGSTFWGHLMGRRMPELSDMAHSAIAIITDSTERKAAESALQSARDEAVRANKAKNVFLASISHEIRTPLHAVINLGFLASLHSRDPVIDNYLLQIQEAGKALSRIIDDLLDLSKVEAGALVMEPVPFRLMDVLDNLMTLVNTLNRKPLELLVMVAPETPLTLHGDPQRLGQVLLNLMSNALKFTDQGRVELRVALVHAGDREAVLRFAVTDTGCGMEESQLRQLFQPFYQGENGLARRLGGAGLGLAISRHLVTLMGGEFAIDSQPGQGSRFSFTALFGVTEQSVVGGQAGVPGLQEDLQISLEQLSGARVLVVEDVEINQRIILELLRRVGVEVKVAGSGGEAMALVDSHVFDLVLLDLKLPDLDGFEVARRLRAMPRLRDLPIIAMTAYAFSSDRQLCLESGMNDHLAKPIDRSLLYAALRRWLRPVARTDITSGPTSPPLPAPVEDPLLPVHLPGIDREAGLGRVLGNVLLYRVLLRKFGQTYGQFGQEVHQLLQVGDDARARRMLHALGGVAGNLGAQELMTASRALERVCVPGCSLEDPVLMEHWNRFLSSLAQVHNVVKPLLEIGKGLVDHPLDPETRNRAREHVEELEELVRGGDVVEAMRVLALLQRELLETPWMEEVEALMEHLFEGNLVLAATVVRRLGGFLGEPDAAGQTV
ncbi:MAG: PAS domain S-box protein [Magnetococcales bacterium]|nr:PAS domain S-box protein [Magnetococcales bacterium]